MIEVRVRRGIDDGNVEAGAHRMTLQFKDRQAGIRTAGDQQAGAEEAKQCGCMRHLAASIAIESIHRYASRQSPTARTFLGTIETNFRVDIELL